MGAPHRKASAATLRPRATDSRTQSTLDLVRAGLTASLDPAVVERVLKTYEEIKTNYYLGGHRLSAVEAGRFCEAVVRLLQQHATGAFTPLAAKLEVERELRRIESGSSHESVRLHIPRVIRVVYGIRNKRDNAHLNDGIDPNIQDSTLIADSCDWIMAELVQLHHNVSPAKATTIVQDLVSKKAPLIQDFEGYLKVLDPVGRRSPSLASLPMWAPRSNRLTTWGLVTPEYAYTSQANTRSVGS